MEYLLIKEFLNREYCDVLNNKYELSLKEPDEYSMKSHYVATYLDNNHINGAARLIEGTNNQIAKTFNKKFDDSTCELSRLVVCPSSRGDVKVMRHLILEAHNLANKLGYKYFVAIANIRLARLLSMNSCSHIEEIDDVNYFGQKSKILRWDVQDGLSWYLNSGR